MPDIPASDMRPFIILILSSIMLGGCGLPVAVQIASLAIDGISLVSTGKTTTDHALSTAANSDCALHRSLKGEDICRDGSPDLAEGTGAQ
ncbi:MAG: hypothetical protein VW835_16955 [Rickettsiales bacterium]|jgi:hypothetical protein